jgi:hypothetical protein
MDSLQELIFRGRFVMANAPERLKVFECVNGRRNTDEIARILKRHVNSVRRDLTILADAGLIQPVIEKGEEIKKNNFPVFEKIPLARAIPLRYFSTPTKLPGTVETGIMATGISRKNVVNRVPKSLIFPTEQEILQIAKNGEDQIYEFKRQGTDVQKLTKEVAAMLNTHQGGIIFYGIEDDGTIEGSDVELQKLDQPLQNSIRNAISPSATIKLKAIEVLGNKVIVIIVPPWNKKNIYQFNEKVYIRKGTNVFAAKPDELRDLHSGKYVT